MRPNLSTHTVHAAAVQPARRTGTARAAQLALALAWVLGTLFGLNGTRAFAQAAGTAVQPAAHDAVNTTANAAPNAAPGGPGAVDVKVVGPISYRPAAQAQAAVPILNYLANDEVCDSWIEVQNVGVQSTKASLVVWGSPGFCPPQAAGPLKVECTGLLKPGSTWNILGAQMPTGAKSGLLVSWSTKQLSEVGLDEVLGFDDVIADLFCETLFFGIVGDADDYRRFKLAYDTGGIYAGIPLDLAIGQPIAAEVLRKCNTPDSPGVITSKYETILGTQLGRYDPVFGGYGMFAPIVYANASGFESTIYVQNLGLECSSIEIWFQRMDDCLRAQICDIVTLAPGETFQYSASDCVGPDWIGSAWLRSTQPLGLVVDHSGAGGLMTYNGTPSQLQFNYNGTPVFTAGTQVAYGPLVYSEYQGWDTGIQVQNLSATVNAKVKVYFLDRSGDIITTLVDWVCPRGSQSFYLPQVADLPGNWVGSVRVESQEWFTPGGPVVDAPMITAVAQLIKYADVQRSSVSEAMAYNLLPEYDAFDWQVGCCEGGLASGEGLIAIPSLIKDLKSSGVTSELAITNLVPKPGYTDFAIYVFDQNGLFDYVCQKLDEKEVEYIDLQTWGYVNQGFKGSALISAVYWDHDVFDSGGRFLRNLVGLGAVTVERTGTTLLTDVPGDEAAGSLGIPVEMPYGYLGPNVPICPGVPTILGRPVFCPPVVTVDSGAVGLMITDNQTTSSTISVTGIPTSCVVTDVNLFLNVRHPNNGQLAAQLAEQTPADTLTRQLYANLCSQTANTVTTLDDDSASPIGSVCPPIGGRYATGGGLDAFDGRPVAGDWTLRISDNAVGSQGSLQNWSLEIRTRQQ